MNRSILSELAERANIDEKLAEKVVKSFWSSIRYYITNPFESKGSILLDNFGKFSLNYKKAYVKANNPNINLKIRMFYKEILKLVNEYAFKPSITKQLLDKLECQNDPEKEVTDDTFKKYIKYIDNNDRYRK